MSPTARRYFGCVLPLVLAALGCGTVLMGTVAGRAVAQYVPIEDAAMAPILPEGTEALVFYTLIWAIEPRVGITAQLESPDGRRFRRLVAGPGQRVSIEDGRLLVDGEPSDPAANARGDMDAMAPLILGQDEYFVLADDRSFPDSRDWGPIPRERIYGEPLFYREGGETVSTDSGVDPDWQRSGSRR